MAAFSLTATSVKLVSGAVNSVTAQAAVSAGQAITADGYVVDPTNTSRLGIAGVAIQSADSGGKIVYAGEGAVISFSDTLTTPAYIFADASGQLQYEGDITSGDQVIRVGITSTANRIIVDPKNTGFAKA